MAEPKYGISQKWLIVEGSERKFPMLRFPKGYYSPSFHLISTKFYCKYVGHDGIQSVTAFGDLPKFKNFRAL